MAQPAVPEEDFEDLRLAVVMNGGVSLAIWIGGVAEEINRLTRSKAGDGSPYGQLLALVRSTARVDVIAGTSAGGINGAFLALAAVYDRDLSLLGELWAKKGGLLDLLRPPLEADPPSLMRGDAYFLAELRTAFESLCPPGRRGTPRSTYETPISLTMTTSLMNGTLRRFTDDFGNPVVDVEHRGRFLFERHERTLPGNDPFDDDGIAARLALASRSTASFPFAFEPSYVAIGAPADELHPDMSGAVNFPSSRYVLDGGVLLNKPVRPALEAIFARVASRQVRRVLAYVVPDPGDPQEATPDVYGQTPTLAQVITDSLVTLPRAQSIIAELDDLREHNRKVRDLRLLRPDLAGLAPQVQGLAGALFPTYRLMRARRAVTSIADAVGPLTAPALEEGTPPAWTREEFLAAFGADGDVLLTPMPFLPSDFTTADNGGPWRWGLAPAERLGGIAVDLLRRGLEVAPLDAADLRARIRHHRRRLHGYLASLRSFRTDDRTFWTARAKRLGTPPAQSGQRPGLLQAWANESLELWPQVAAGTGTARADLLHGLERIVYSILDLLAAVAPDLYEAVDRRSETDDPVFGAAADALSALLVGLGFPPGEVSDEQARGALQRLLALEVVSVALDFATAEVEQDVQLVKVAGDTPNGFGARSAVDKLAGVQLGHFGAFYKKTWRVNDWLGVASMERRVWCRLFWGQSGCDSSGCHGKTCSRKWR